MKKFLAVFALLTPLLVLAATTWSSVTTDAAGKPIPSYVRAVRGTNTVATGTENAPSCTAASRFGLDLQGIEGIAVRVRTTTGGNMTAGGWFRAYTWSPITGLCYRPSDASLDFASSATSLLTTAGFTVTADYGRILWIPDTVGTTVYVEIEGTRRSGVR